MRILYIVPYVPNLVRVRPYNLIRALVSQGHSVTLATLWSADDERNDIESLIADGVTNVIARQLTPTRTLWNSLRAIPTSHPLQANYCWHPGLTTAIAEELSTQRYDVVHVEHLRGAVFGLRARTAACTPGYRPPVIWDSVDSISHLFEQAAEQSASRKGRIMTRLELNRTRRHEADLAAAFDRVLVTSPADREAFLGLDADTNADTDHIAVVPNGVDTEYFSVARDEVPEPTLLISGKMSYHANITMVLHLVNEIMPLVWDSRPEVKVWIVGKDPPAAIRQLGDYLPGAVVSPPYSDPTASVVVTGTVPDMRTYLHRATVGVAPVLYGAGIQNKVLEAMACGLPVIASPIAVSALDAVDGQDVVVASHASEFARQILDVLNDSSRRAQMSASGRIYVEQHHSWPAIGRILVENYRSTIRAAAGETPVGCRVGS